MRTVDRFAQRSRKIYNGQDVLKNHFLKRYPILYTDDIENYDQIKKYADQHEFIWIVDRSIETLQSFPWHFRPNEKDTVHLFPYVYKKSRRVKSWRSVKLVPTNYNGDKTVTHPHICGIYDVYNGKDRFDMFFIGEANETFSKLSAKFSNIKLVKSHNEARTLSETDMFWLIPDDVIVKDTFNFSFEPDEWSFKYTHVFGNGDSKTQDGIALFPKNYEPTERELTHRFYANKKEIKIVASDPIPYYKSKIKNYGDYQKVLKKSTTDLFWYVPDDVSVGSLFKFDLYFDHHNQYDRTINHVFLNDRSYDGIVLFSKHSPITEREFDHRFIANKKEWDIVASKPKPYDKFTINNYEDYVKAKEKSSTEMFWGVPSDVDVKNNLDLYFDHHNQYDRNITHVFLNDQSYDGVVLYSKNVELTKKEIKNRFFVNKKEHNKIYSVPKSFDYFEIDSYKEYLSALEKSSTEMFWMSSRNIDMNKDLIKTFYISHHETIDRNQNHVFIHQANEEKLYNGLFLCSKHHPLNEREVEHRHPVERKEWNIVGSTAKKYDVFEIDTYQDYLLALKKSSTEMFWMIPPEVDVSEDFKFDMYFDHSNGYDRHINHVFKNGNAYDGVALLSKHSIVSEKEVTMRFFAHKKSQDILASNPKLYDIVFISNGEKFADENFENLKKRFPRAQRVSNVKGIHQAHIAAASLCSTGMFWVVDADAEIIENFDFDYQVARIDQETVHVWKALNPINKLIYGYGAVKLLPTELTKNVDVNSADMTTSISSQFKSVNRVSNTTKFNTDEFSTWRSAFRECVKLASKTIQRQNTEETEFRLTAWCTRGENETFGKACIAGAIAGKAYGLEHTGDVEALRMINNFEWLEDQFKQSYQST
jgi:hypothetical protein